MICRSSTRNPVQVRAVQFYSSLVDTNGCGHVWRDSGRVRPATVIGLRPAAAQLRPENSAGCGFGQMSRIKCHALLGSLSKLKNLCARTFFAFVQLSGENPMSHLMSPVFRFQLEAELRLNLCAEPKNMANSALKCHF